jgi:hypothetical protein
MAKVKVKDLPIEVAPTVLDYLVFDKADGSITEKTLIGSLPGFDATGKMKFFAQPLSTADIKTANTVPVIIADLPNMGVGFAWAVVYSAVAYTYGGTVFTNGSLNIRYTGSAQYQKASQNFLPIAGSTYIAMQEVATAGRQILDNVTMEIFSFANSAVGNGQALVVGFAILLPMP